MDIQRLRTLTTGRLHTAVGHDYEDLGTIIGADLMTHMIPRAMRAIEMTMVGLVIASLSSQACIVDLPYAADEKISAIEDKIKVLIEQLEDIFLQYPGEDGNR